MSKASLVGFEGEVLVLLPVSLLPNTADKLSWGK